MLVAAVMLGTDYKILKIVCDFLIGRDHMSHLKKVQLVTFLYHAFIKYIPRTFRKIIGILSLKKQQIRLD